MSILPFITDSEGGVSYDADATALFARMSSQPDDARKALYNTLILALKAGGAWAKWDICYILAAHTSQAARLNLISSSYTLSAVSSPTFTTDRGYNGDGASSYLNTGYAAAVGKLTQDDHSLGVWVQLGIGINNNFVAGTTYHAICPKNASASAISCRSSNTATNAGADSSVAEIGLSTLIRENSSSLLRTQKNAVTKENHSRTSVAAGADTLFIGGINSAGSLSLPNARRVAVLFAGASLTDAQSLAAYNAFNAFLTGVGAV